VLVKLLEHGIRRPQHTGHPKPIKPAANRLTRRVRTKSGDALGKFFQRKGAKNAKDSLLPISDQCASAMDFNGLISILLFFDCFLGVPSRLRGGLFPNATPIERVVARLRRLIDAARDRSRLSRPAEFRGLTAFLLDL
jgi:hypothetical protein